MRNIKLSLAYDGTKYHGFQKQNNTTLKTIQDELEKALSKITNESIIVNGSGRTDAGVHAKGQVVNFFSSTTIPSERISRAVNSVLPPDIRVWQAEDMPQDFHARFAAKRKTYCYTIYNDRQMSPFWRYYAYHVPVSLDTNKMKKGAENFVGTHDFHGFCAKNTAVNDYVRTIFSCQIEKEECLLRLYITGSGFLYNMVRIVMGTLLEIGKGKRDPEDIIALIKAKNRKLSGITLPPQGLCLFSVVYEDEVQNEKS